MRIPSKKAHSLGRFLGRQYALPESELTLGRAPRTKDAKCWMERTSDIGSSKRNNEEIEKPSWRREELLLLRNDDIRRAWMVNKKIGAGRSGA
jgi:hypothetical protein